MVCRLAVWQTFGKVCWLTREREREREGERVRKRKSLVRRVFRCQLTAVTGFIILILFMMPFNQKKNFPCFHWDLSANFREIVNSRKSFVKNIGHFSESGILVSQGISELDILIEHSNELNIFCGTIYNYCRHFWIRCGICVDLWNCWNDKPAVSRLVLNFEI